MRGSARQGRFPCEAPLKRAERIVILTGSGISAESGLSTFRDKGGVWARHDWRDVATPEGFAADPARVHAFYNERRRALGAVAPNAAHVALAELERRLAEKGGRLTLVTQNVDDLHARAGSRNLIAMHGELRKARCGACGSVRDQDADLDVATRCPDCAAEGFMRPHVVWFGETPLYLVQIAEEIARADRFVAIGTSGSVYPAAGFVEQARASNIPCTELNLERTAVSWAFTDARYGKAGEIVPLWASEACPE